MEVVLVFHTFCISGVFSVADKWPEVTHLAYGVRNPSNLAGMHTMGKPTF